MRRFWRGAAGYTLAETLVGVGILAIVTGIIGTALFQALGTQKSVVDDGLAINELRRGLSWLAEDVKMAQATNLVEGAQAISCLSGVTCATFSWTDQFADGQVLHNVSYKLVGDRLERTYDSQTHTVAHRVTSMSLSLTSKTVHAQFEVDSGSGTTRTLSVKTLMRSTV